MLIAQYWCRVWTIQFKRRILHCSTKVWNEMPLISLHSGPIVKREAIGAENWNGFMKKCQFLGQFAKSISVKYWQWWEDILIICLPFRLCTELSAGAGGPTTTVYPPNIHLSHTIGTPRCILYKYIQCIFPQLFIHLTICQLENSFYMAYPELFA